MAGPPEGFTEIAAPDGPPEGFSEIQPTKPSNWFTRTLFTTPDVPEMENKVAAAGKIPIPVSKGSSVSAEKLADFLPAIGATAGATLGAPALGIGAVPGSALGGGLGEGARQLLRRLGGQPAATGLGQELAGLDPNSPLASALGIADESALGPIAEGVSGVLKAGSRAFGRSAQRSLVSLLQPSTQIEKQGAMDLTKRMVDEGIAPMASTRASQVANAQQALADATAKRTAVEAGLTANPNAMVSGRPALDASISSVPDLLPAGQVPRTGRAARKAASNVAEDVMTSLEKSNNLEVPFSTAQAEKRRWDAMLKSFYERGRENVPEGARSVKNVADAWRGAIATEFPEMGAANLRESELISITKMLADAHERIAREGIVKGTEGAAAAGAAGAGRWSIPFMTTAKALSSTGPWASLSAAGKETAAKLLMMPASSSQAWLRMADYFNNPDEAKQ